MASSIASRFKRSLADRKNVYGLPTGRGLLLFLIMSSAFWFSVVHQAAIEQWISVLMILFVLVHLSELNEQFRDLELAILPFDPPFASDAAEIPVQLFNPGQATTPRLWLKFTGSATWVEAPPLLARGSRSVYLPLGPLDCGEYPMPAIRVRTRATSELFRLWRVVKVDAPASVRVLPAAIDHGISPYPSATRPDDAELSHLEVIQDPRLLPKMDQKLFQKTGLPYLRALEPAGWDSQLSLRWQALESLALTQRAEQFSFWIKIASRSSGRAYVEAPFFRGSPSGARLPWRELKNNFATWLRQKEQTP